MGLTLTPVQPRNSWKDKTPEQFRQAENERKASSRNVARADRAARHELTFVCVDGEGAGEGDTHKYVLLGCGDAQLENSSGIEWSEAFRFLYDEFLKHAKGTVFAGFFLGYDYTQILKGLPENKAWQLLMQAGQDKRKRKASHGNHTPFPVRAVGRAGAWEFDIHADRRLKIRPKTCGCPDDAHIKGVKCGQDQTPWMYINDAGGFFQTSFLNVINPAKWTDPVVTQAEYADIERGKRKRSSAKLDDAMRRYNQLENQVLARVLAELNKGLVEAGVMLNRRQWYGPGQAAQAWLRVVGAPLASDIKAVTSARVLDAARRSYYGGWFEIMAHGHLPGVTWEYDINSAYPHVIASLPCLLHGSWQSRKPRMPVASLPELPTGSLRLVSATVQGSDPYIGTMLHRTVTQSILRPEATRGWFWQHELDAAKRAGLINRAEYHEWHTYTPCECFPPMRDMASLYRRRLAVGKNTAQGKAFKLVYNSAYGKFAQSVGEPPYANPVYASLITAGCRTMILDAIATHPGRSSAVVMVATDGVYLTSEHPGLPVSGSLGEWEVSQRHNLTLFKPGVYWDDATRADVLAGRKPVFKSRGVNAEAFGAVLSRIDAMFAAWNGQYPASDDAWPSEQFELGFSMVTAKQALQWHKWHLAGQVSARVVRQDSNPSDKRDPGSFADGIYRSTPKVLERNPDTGIVQLSVPYDKSFGSAEMFRTGRMDADAYGITPDGHAVDRMYEAFGIRG